MTPEQQSRADHIALVAAPILANAVNYVWELTKHGEATQAEILALDLPNKALDIAEKLQKAAEERVKG